MIPLSLFLIAWLVLLGIYGLIAMISMIQMARFSIGGFWAYGSTLLFVAVAGLALLGTANYLVTVDWGQGLNIGQLFSGSSYIPQ